jgi:hypothetical protein
MSLILRRVKKDERERSVGMKRTNKEKELGARE